MFPILKLIVVFTVAFVFIRNIVALGTSNITLSGTGVAHIRPKRGVRVDAKQAVCEYLAVTAVFLLLSYLLKTFLPFVSVCMQWRT